MHMANELLSPTVAASTLGIASIVIGFVCRKVRQRLSSEKYALMGVLGAFVFAAQMVQFQLPLMAGTSGHLVGAVLLTIVLGPNLAAIVITSVVILQCLIFQDGGILALGCNIINMGIVPCYLGYFVFRSISGAFGSHGGRLYFPVVAAGFLAIEAGAILVPIEATFSGVLNVPFKTFAFTMASVHLPIGLIEGFITAAVIEYLRQTRSDILSSLQSGKNRLSFKAVLAALLIAAIVIGGLSLFASELPDGLEWSYATRPDEPQFKPIVDNENTAAAAAENFQRKYTIFPNYTIRTVPFGKIATDEISASAAWTSLAAIIGSASVMLLIYGAAFFLRKQ